MKALGLVVSDKKFFENCILKTYFRPRDLLMQSTGTVWTTLVEDHQGVLPVKFGQNPTSGFREKLFKEIVDTRTHGQWTTDNGPSQKLTLSTKVS